MTKEAYYFSHDSNARHDPKILEMRSVYGAEGYGWYWIIIEMLREQSDYKIKLTKYVWNALAMQMQCSADAAHKFVSDCINEFKLFESDGEYFWSNSLIRRMKSRDERSEKARKAAQARWQKANNDKGSSDFDDVEDEQCDSNADAMQTQCDSNAIKEKKIKEKKIKENKERERYGDYVLLTPQEYEKLLDKGMTPEERDRYIELLDNYIGSKGKKYKSHYHTILNWYRRDQIQSSKPSEVEAWLKSG